MTQTESRNGEDDRNRLMLVNGTHATRTQEISFTIGECGPTKAGAKVVSVEAANIAYDEALRSATCKHFNDIRRIQEYMVSTAEQYGKRSEDTVNSLRARRALLKEPFILSQARITEAASCISRITTETCSHLQDAFKLRLSTSFLHASDQNMAAISKLKATARGRSMNECGMSEIQRILDAAELDRDMWDYNVQIAMRTAQDILRMTREHHEDMTSTRLSTALMASIIELCSETANEMGMDSD